MSCIWGKAIGVDRGLSPWARLPSAQLNRAWPIRATLIKELMIVDALQCSQLRGEC